MSNISHVSHLEGHRSPKNSHWLSVTVIVQVLFCHFGSLQWFQTKFGNLSFISDPLDFHRFAWIASSCVLNSKGLTSPYIWKSKVIKYNSALRLVEKLLLLLCLVANKRSCCKSQVKKLSWLSQLELIYGPRQVRALQLMEYLQLSGSSIWATSL